MNMLFGKLFEGGWYLGAAYLGVKSLENDRIWPWRWTLPYVGNLLVRSGLSVLFVYGELAFVEKKRLDGWGLVAVLVGTGILLLSVFFPQNLNSSKKRKWARNRMNSLSLTFRPSGRGETTAAHGGYVRGPRCSPPGP